MDMRRSSSGFEKQYMMSTSLYGTSMNTAKQNYGTYHAVVATGVSHGGITGGSLLSKGYAEAVEAAGLGHGGSLIFNHGESVEEGFSVNKFKLPSTITYAEAEAEEHYDEFKRLIMGSGRSNRHVRQAAGRYVQQQQQQTKKQQLNGGNISFVMRQQPQQQEEFVSGEHYYYSGHRGGYYRL